MKYCMHLDLAMSNVEKIEKYLQIKTENNQYTKNSCGLTHFDPFSIMLYCEEDYTMERKQGDEIWTLKPKDYKLNDSMSELDKLALNIMYPS